MNFKIYEEPKSEPKQPYLRLKKIYNGIIRLELVDQHGRFIQAIADFEDGGMLKYILKRNRAREYGIKLDEKGRIEDLSDY